MRWARSWHGAVGLMVLAALVIQVVIAVNAPGAPTAHSVGTLRGTHLPGRLVRVASFFTIQSNVWCALASLQLARSPDESGRWWRAVRLAGLFGITVTGLVYGTVLAEVHDPQGWAEVSTNAVFHYVTPIAVVVGWLWFGPRPRVDRRTMVIALGWPVLWSAWTLVHGAVTQWYPYPFVDVAKHGYVVVLGNSLLVLALLAGVVAIIRWADRALPSAPRDR